MLDITIYIYIYKCEVTTQHNYLRTLQLGNKQHGKNNRWKKYRNKEVYAVTSNKPGNIHQLQGKLNMYFTIPTSGNI